MHNIAQIKNEIEAARQTCLSLEDSGTRAEYRAATEKLKDLRKRLSDAIADGANACPTCSGPAVGMEQPDGFEVGCPNCGWFQDGDVARDHGARAGRLPRHAVETWNEGPYFWKTKSRELLEKSGEWEKLKPAPAWHTTKGTP